MVLLYHYTDQAGLDAIYKTNVVKASSGGAYGAGVYFTELDPKTPKLHLALNNWGSLSTARTQFWYKFKSEDYPAIKQVSSGIRNIWLHPGDMKLHENSHVKLYHYTDQMGRDGIYKSGFIKKSQPKDVTCPAGVYFTELRPEYSTDRKKRMLKVFGSSARDEALYRKTKYWFRFRVGDLKGVCKRRAAHRGYEWVFDGDVNIRLGRR